MAAGGPSVPRRQPSGRILPIVGVAAMGLRLSQVIWVCCAAQLLSTCEAVKSTVWHKHDYEYDFAEAIVLITIVVLALAFELTWHSLGHQVKHAYHYGEYHDHLNNDGDVDAVDSHGNMRHVKLITELYTRVSGEFMTLGVLAFTIFASNQFGVFEWLVKTFPPCEDRPNCFGRPNNSSDWLFLVEMVHMKLFLGMLFYFCLVFRLVRSATNKVKNFERRRLEQLLHMEYDIHFGEYNPDLRQFVVFSEYFAGKIMRLRKKRASLHNVLCSKLGIDPTDQLSEVKIKDIIQERFSFAAYLALNIENGVVDTINVHITTWLAVVVLFSVFALLHRFSEVNQSSVLPIIISVAFFTLVSMWLLTRRRLGAIHRHADKVAKRSAQAVPEGTEGQSVDESAMSDNDIGPRHGRSSELMNDKLAEGIEKASTTLDGRHDWSAEEDFGVHKHSRERIVLRIMQLVVFAMSYCSVSAITDANMWKEHFYVELAESLAFMILWVTMAAFMPVAVPNFLCLMCIPPYVDDNNLQAFWTVLDDHMIKRKGKANKSDHATEKRLVAVPPTAGSDQKEKIRALFRRARSSSDNAAEQAVWELADILSVRHELELRMKESNGQCTPITVASSAWKDDAEQRGITVDSGLQGTRNYYSEGALAKLQRGRDEDTSAVNV